MDISYGGGRMRNARPYGTFLMMCENLIRTMHIIYEKEWFVKHLFDISNKLFSALYLVLAPRRKAAEARGYKACPGVLIPVISRRWGIYMCCVESG